MQPSQSFLKHMIRLIILSIIFVCMCLISAFLYSTRYWPDIYNYINANITIERIPTISELNIQIVEVRYDDTTETYSTTDADYFELSTTDDFDVDEFMSSRFDTKTKVKRDVVFEEINDYGELPNKPIFVDYIFLEDPIEISSKENNTDDEPRILRTMFTKEIMEDETDAVLKTNIDEYTTKMYDNKDTNYNNINILTPKESNLNNTQLVLHVGEYPVHLTTTRERYLIGDEINTEFKNQPTTEPIVITTETSDNDFGKKPVKLLKYLVDVSKLSTRRLEDAADDSSMMMNSVEDVEEYSGEHKTTRESFVIGDEIYTKMKNQPTMESLEITTETNDDFDTKHVKFLKYLVDVSKLSTRRLEDAADDSSMMMNSVEDVEEYSGEHKTTRESFVIGDEIYTKMKNQPTMESLEITTEKNDDFDTKPVKFLKYLVDVSKLSTRRLKDTDDSSMMMNSMEDVEEYSGQHQTTRESFFIGGEIYTKMKNQLALESLEITTETNDDFDTKPVKLLKDLVDVKKLSTRPPEDVEIIANTSDAALSHMTFTNTVFPWVATIFIKNSTDNSQFHYYCDGALLSEKVILTGGRCVYHSSGLVAPENILVFLGKANLQSMGGNEKLHRVKNVVLHHNFTIDYMSWAVHDLALLILDVAAVFDDRVQSACLHNNMDEPTEVEEAATTSWGPSGQLLPIFFEKQRSDICLDKSEDIFCATYGANVPLCPNYGGIYVAKRMSRWCVQALFYGDPSYRGLCFNKNVLFTSLRNYYDWIDDYIVINSNIL